MASNLPSSDELNRLFQNRTGEHRGVYLPSAEELNQHARPADNMLGADYSRSTNFSDSWDAGWKNWSANLTMAGAMVQDLFGVDNSETVDRAVRMHEQAAIIGAANPTFEDFLESRDFNTFADWFIGTAGSFAPDVIESVITTTAGAVIGTAMAPGAGTVGGAATGFAARTAIRSKMRQEARQALQRVRAGTGTATDQQVLRDLTRSHFAQVGGLVGTSAGSMPTMTGAAYQESHDAGHPNAWGALGVGLGMTSLNTLGQASAVAAASRLFRQSNRMNGPLATSFKTIAGATASEGFTELGQEEMLIRFHDFLNDDVDYAQSAEARSRRIEAVAAGSAMGASRGAAFEAPTRVFSEYRDAGRRLSETGGDPSGTIPGGQDPNAPPGGFMDAVRGKTQEETAKLRNILSQFDPVTDENGFVLTDTEIEQRQRAQQQQQTAEAAGTQRNPFVQAMDDMFKPVRDKFNHEGTLGQFASATKPNYEAGQPTGQKLGQNIRRTVEDGLIEHPIAQRGIEAVEQGVERAGEATMDAAQRAGQATAEQAARAVDTVTGAARSVTEAAAPHARAAAETSSAYAGRAAGATAGVVRGMQSQNMEDGLSHEDLNQMFAGNLEAETPLFNDSLFNEQEATSDLTPEQRQVELDALINEQQADDTHTIQPEYIPQQPEFGLVGGHSTSQRSNMGALPDAYETSPMNQGVDAPAQQQQQTAEQGELPLTQQRAGEGTTPFEQGQQLDPITAEATLDVFDYFNDEGEARAFVHQQILDDLDIPQDAETGERLLFNIQEYVPAHRRDLSPASAAFESTDSLGTLTQLTQLDESRITSKNQNAEARSAGLQHFPWKRLTPNAEVAVVMDQLGNHHIVPKSVVTMYRRIEKHDHDNGINSALTIVFDKPPGGELRATVLRHRDRDYFERSGMFYRQDGKSIPITQRIQMALDMATYKGRDSNRNKAAFSLPLVRQEDPNKKPVWVNPRILATAGMDTTQGMGGNITSQRRRTGFMEALSHLYEMGYMVPHTHAQLLENRKGVLRDVLTTTKRGPAPVSDSLTGRAKDLWAAKTFDEKAHYLEILGHDPDLTSVDPSELPPDVRTELNGDASAEFTSTQDTETDSSSETRMDFDSERPQVNPDAIAREADKKREAGYRPNHKPLPEHSAGVRIDPLLASDWIGDFVQAARAFTGMKRSLVVITEGSDLQTVLASLDPRARRILEAAEASIHIANAAKLKDAQARFAEYTKGMQLTDKQKAQLWHEQGFEPVYARSMIEQLNELIQGKRIGKYSGTAVPGNHLDLGHTSIVYISRNITPENQAFSLAHELGHSVFFDHIKGIMDDPVRLTELYKAYNQDAEQGLVNQYDNFQDGFMEWFADRYGSWLRRRVANNTTKVAKAGGFAQLKSNLSKLARNTKAVIRKLTGADGDRIGMRDKGNATIDAMFDNIARAVQLRNEIQGLESKIKNTPRRFQVDSYVAQLRLAKAELARMNTYDLDNAGAVNERRMGLSIEDQVAMQIANERSLQEINRDKLKKTIETITDPDLFAPDRETNAEWTPMDDANDMYARRLNERMARRDKLAKNTNKSVANAAVEADMTAKEKSGAVKLHLFGNSMDGYYARMFMSDDGGDGAGGPGNTLPSRADHFNPDQLPMDPFAEAFARDLFENSRSNSFKDFLNKLYKQVPGARKAVNMFKALAYTANGELKSMGQEAARLARMFWSSPGDTGPRGWFNRVESQTQQRLARLSAITDGLTKEAASIVYAEVQSERPTELLSDRAKQIRTLLDELGEYGQQHIRGFTARKNYGTRTYDIGEIIARPEEFVHLVQQHTQGLTTSQIQEMMMTMAHERDGAAVILTSDQAGSAPGLNAKASRVLHDIPNEVLQNSGFLADPQASVYLHVKALVKRAETERMFGGEKDGREVLHDMEMRAAEGRMVDREFMADLRQGIQDDLSAGRPVRKIYDPMARVKQQLDTITDPTDRERARKIVEGYMGRNNRFLGMQMSPTMSRLMSLGVAYTFMTTLGLAVFSQFVDVATTAMRMRSPTAFADVFRTVKQFSREERADLAKRLGIVQSEITMSALHNTYGNDYMTPGVRRASDAFFKWIGLQAITDHNRALAAQMGLGFISSAFQKTVGPQQARGTMHTTADGMATDPTALRHLQELGLEPSDVATFFGEVQQRAREQGLDPNESFYNTQLMDFTTEAGQKMQQALTQFTDEAILRPNAAMRPGWGSNPWFQLFWVLKSFAWGGKAVFIDGMIREFRAQRREGKPFHAALGPMYMAGAMGIPLALTGLVARDAAKHGLNSLFDDDDYEWVSTNTNWASMGGMSELVDRAGLIGPASIAFGAYKGTEFGTPIAVGMAGPFAERAYRLTQGDTERVVRDSVPVIGLVL